MATYAIGDIQGCYDSFMRLLESFHFNPASDKLWLVGDLVNRGPRSLDTLRFVRDQGEAAVTVLGNHDLTLLIIAAGFRKADKHDTLEEILQAPDCDELLNWLRSRKLCHHEAGYFMVHAGLLPQWTVDQASLLAREVEKALTQPDWREFLANMWGNKPVQWDDHLEGWPRLRAIVNGMTRLRFCTAQGEMDFMSKGELVDTPAGYMPWFDVPWRKSADTTLVTGHWSALGLKVSHNLLALDSGCLWGGKLTAIRLEDRKIFQVDCAEEEARSIVS